MRFTYMFALLLKAQTTQPHLLYIPHAGHEKGKLIERGVGLLYSLPQWNVSIRHDGELNNQEVAAKVRSSTEVTKLRQPFLSAQCHALKQGLPITTKMRPLEDVEDEPGADEQTQQDIRAGKQSVLSKATPAAKVVLNVPKPKAVSSAPQTRAASTSEMDLAADMEKQSQDHATSRAKRQRQEDEAKAAAAAPAKKQTRGSGLKPPRKEAKGRVREPASEDDQ